MKTAKIVNQAASDGPWYASMNGYHWWVLIAASLGWLFDTMGQRIFVLARGPAIESLLPMGTPSAEIKFYSGLATAIFMIGWAFGGFYFGIMGDRWGRAKTMMITILCYSEFSVRFVLAASSIAHGSNPAQSQHKPTGHENFELCHQTL